MEGETSKDGSEEEISLLSWLNLNQDFVEEVADILKDEIKVIKERKIRKHQDLLKHERKGEAVHISKSIVAGFQNAISKAVTELQTLASNMSEEIQKRFNLPDDWLQSGSGSSVAGSEVHAPPLRSNLIEQKLPLPSSSKSQFADSAYLNGDVDDDDAKTVMIPLSPHMKRMREIKKERFEDRGREVENVLEPSDSETVKENAPDSPASDNDDGWSRSTPTPELKTTSANDSNDNDKDEEKLEGEVGQPQSEDARDITTTDEEQADCSSSRINDKHNESEQEASASKNKSTVTEVTISKEVKEHKKSQSPIQAKTNLKAKDVHDDQEEMLEEEELFVDARDVSITDEEQQNSKEEKDTVDKIESEKGEEVVAHSSTKANNTVIEVEDKSKEAKERKKRHSPGMSAAERRAMNEVLKMSSSSDDDFITRRDTKSPKRRRKEREVKQHINMESMNWKEDPKLKEDAAQVVVEKLDNRILAKLETEKFIELNGYSKMLRMKGDVNSESDDDNTYESDDSMKQLQAALKSLTKNSITLSKLHSSKKKSFKERTKQNRKSEQRNFELISSDDDMDDQKKPSPAKGVGRSIISSDDDLKSGSGSEDLDSASNEDKPKNKTKSQPVKTPAENKKKQKKYISAKVSSSDSDNERGDMRDVLGSDCDSESRKEGSPGKRRKLRPRESIKKEKKKDGSSCSDSDSKKKSKSKNKKADSTITLSSGSETIMNRDSDDSDFANKSRKNKGKTKIRGKKSGNSSESSSSVKCIESDDSDDSDFIKAPKRKRKFRSSDSDNKPKSKKKRRRIITQNSDTDKISNDSEIEEVGPSDNEDASPSQKGRKNIRKIMSSKELARSTKEAEKDEEIRRKRLSERQALFNGFHQAPESNKVERLILDVDPETKEPVIEVDPTIATKLKPHQAEGIKFMYNACFESVDMIKENKVPGGCILAHCMGLGKTLQSVAFVHTVLTNEICNTKTALIICPLSTVANWFNEFQQWTHNAESLNLHKLYEAKASAESRIDYLRTFRKRGGVGIIHYDMFVRLADPKKKMKIKEKLRTAIDEALLDPGPDIVICDEGHLLKNHKSQRAIAVNQIRSTRRVVLTGTPLQNNLVEYHTMMNFVKPNLLGSLPEFTNRFVNPIQNGQHADSTDKDVKTMKRRAHVLHRKLEGCVQRFDYSILSPYLPPKHEYIINIKLSKKQEELYKLYLAEVIGTTDNDQKRRNLLKYYAELVKVWSHPIALTMRKDKDDEDEETSADSIKDFIVDDSSKESGSEPEVESGEGSNDSKQKTSQRRTRSKGLDPDQQSAPSPSFGFGNQWWSGVFKSKDEMYDVELSGKLIILQEILRTCESIGDRVLVFSQFLTSLDIIEEFLADWDKAAEEKARAENNIVTFPLNTTNEEGRWRKNREYFRIDGGVKQTDRQRDCDKFNKKSGLGSAKLFLISTKAGGLGINLYGANRVVIFDASWNPSQDMQSIFRVYRFGQDKPCYIYRLIAKGTMEEKILRRQITKLSLSSRVVDEHQIQRHFKFDDVNEMYCYDEDDNESSSSSMAVPKDKLLADLILSHSDWVRGYEEFDSLLENKADEGLSNEEKELAWAEYRIESDRQKQGYQGYEMEVQTYVKVKSRLVTSYKNATEEQIENATKTAIDVIAKIRSLMLTQNQLPEERRGEVERFISPLKLWLQQSVNMDVVHETPDPDQPLLQAVPAAFFANPKLSDFFPVQGHLRPPMPRGRAPYHAGPRYMQQPVPNVNAIRNAFVNAAAMNNPQMNNLRPGFQPMNNGVNFNNVN